jgi:hypothetical protein
MQQALCGHQCPAHRRPALHVCVDARELPSHSWSAFALTLPRQGRDRGEAAAKAIGEAF